MQHISVPQHLAIANSLYANLAYNNSVILNQDFEVQNHSEVFECIEKGPEFTSLSEVNEHTLSAFIKQHLNPGTYFSATRARGKIIFCALKKS